MNLWGAVVSNKQSQTIVVSEDRDLLITRLALAPGTPAKTPVVVSLCNNETQQTFILGTLRTEICEQFELDVNIAATSSITLSVQGNGEVHFTGYYNRLSYYSEDSSSLDEELNENDINQRIAKYMREDSSSGEDYDGANIESLSTSDDSMDDGEESPLSPVKQKTPQITGKLPDTKPKSPNNKQTEQQKSPKTPPSDKKQDNKKPQEKKEQPAKTAEQKTPEQKTPEQKKGPAGQPNKGNPKQNQGKQNPNAGKPQGGKSPNQQNKPQGNKQNTPQQGKKNKNAPQSSPGSQPPNKKQKTQQ